MRAFAQWLMSSVGKKYVLAGTGLALFGFLLTHLAGNFLLLVPDGGTAFNTYAHKLESMGALLYVAEISLLAIFTLHVLTAISVSLLAKRARGTAAGHAPQSKGGASHFSMASRGMILTGVLILVFVVIHIKHFKFGPGITEGYITDIAGEQSRDLYRWVVESFREPVWVAAYCAFMVALGLHLRHGLWSLFQSLGLMTAGANSTSYRIALIVTLLIAGGFFAIPLLIWMQGSSS